MIPHPSKMNPVSKRMPYNIVRGILLLTEIHLLL